MDYIQNGQKYNKRLNCVEQRTLHWSNTLLAQFMKRFQKFEQIIHSQICDPITGSTGQEAGRLAQLKEQIDTQILKEYREVKTEYANKNDFKHFTTTGIEKQVNAQKDQAKRELELAVRSKKLTIAFYKMDIGRAKSLIRETNLTIRSNMKDLLMLL